MRCASMMLAVSVAFCAPGPAAAQEFVLGDKTIIASTPYMVLYVYVAPSGRIYQAHHSAKEVPNFRAKWGVEYEIGKVRDMETRLFTVDGTPVICKHRTSASLTGRTL